MDVASLGMKHFLVPLFTALLMLSERKLHPKPWDKFRLILKTTQ